MDIDDEELAIASALTSLRAAPAGMQALAGKYMIERLARLPVDVDYASEHRYRNPIPDRNAIGPPDHAVWRNRGHPRRAARNEEPGFEDCRYLQCRRRDGGA